MSREYLRNALPNIENAKNHGKDNPHALFLPREVFTPNKEMQVVMQSKKQYPNFQEFCKDTPSFSIALDGIVTDGPKFDKNGPRINIDHHSDVQRLATRSTAAQVEINLAQGLLKAFEDEGKTKTNIYINDCDEDVSLSVFLLKYGHNREITQHPLMSRLVDTTDKLDTTAGTYPFSPTSTELKEQSWVMDPYKQFMLAGGTAKKYESPAARDQAYQKVIGQVENRIIRYLTGDAKEETEAFEPNTSFNILYQDEQKQWALVDKLGAQGRTGMAFAGIPAYVYLKYQDEKAEKFHYSIGRVSELITYFDNPELYDKLNIAEGNNVSKMNKWGGSTIIGGSPLEGSVLAPRDIIEIVTESISPKKK